MRRELVVTPSRWSPRGEAELTVQGRPVVVWQGIVGESARVRVRNMGRNQDYAVFRDTTTPSPHRVEPPCDRYHTCGGCPMMHLDQQGQHEAKRALIQEALAAEGLEDVSVGAFTIGPNPDADFRHVVKLGVGFSDQGRLRVGAWGRHTATIVPIPHCVVAADSLRAAMASVAHHILDLEIPPYDPQTGRGVLRSVVLRASRSTGDVVVTLVAGRRTRSLSELAEVVGLECSAISGVVLHLNEEEGNAIYKRDLYGEIHTKLLRGSPDLTDTLGDVRYRIGPGDFFQTNPAVAEKLYARAIERMELGPEVPFVDLYCGVGGLALAAARHSGWVLGVESLENAVRSARESAREQGLDVTFECDDVEVFLPDLARRLAGVQPVVSVNPARRGLEEGVVEGIAALEPRRIAYISCNPRALARDLAAFRSLGYQVSEVEPFDMFPHTAHVECLVVLHAPEPTSARRAPRRKVVGRPRRS